MSWTSAEKLLLSHIEQGYHLICLVFLDCSKPVEPDLKLCICQKLMRSADWKTLASDSAGACWTFCREITAFTQRAEVILCSMLAGDWFFYSGCGYFLKKTNCTLSILNYCTVLYCEKKGLNTKLQLSNVVFNLHEYRTQMKILYCSIQ